MKKISKMLAIAPSCLAAMLYGGNLLADLSDVYVGLDVLKTNYATQERYGSNVFAKNPMAFNAFVGYKLPRNFFIEMGYERYNTKSKTARIEPGDYYPGAIMLPYWMVLNTKLRNHQTYMGVGASYYFPNFSKTCLTILAGFSETRVKAEFEDISEEGNETPTPADILASRRTFAIKKISPLLRVGVNHQFTNHFGVRFTSTWHKLNNFKIHAAQQSSNAEIRLKNSYTFGIGAFYFF